MLAEFLNWWGEQLGQSPWLLPIICLFLGFLASWIFEKLVLPLLKRWAARTDLGSEDIILAALEGKARIWFVLAGIYLALLVSPLEAGVILVASRLLLAGLIFSITVVAARMSVGFIYLYRRTVKNIIPSTSIFTNLTKITIYTIGTLILIKSMGISITPLLTALGVGGLAVALALQDTLSNFFSGLHIVASSQIRPGDYVRLDSGEEGYVTDVTWRNTTIKAIPNNRIVIPNTSLAGANIINYNLPEKEMTVKVEVGVSYDSDLDEVEKVTLEVAREVLSNVKVGVKEFEPFLRFHTFGDSSIDFTVYLRAKEFFDQYLVRHEFIKSLHERYNQEGIEIPFPIRTVYKRK